MNKEDRRNIFYRERKYIPREKNQMSWKCRVITDASEIKRLIESDVHQPTEKFEWMLEFENGVMRRCDFTEFFRKGIVRCNMGRMGRSGIKSKVSRRKRFTDGSRIFFGFVYFSKVKILIFLTLNKL